jgi:hypothetical protein
MDVPRYLSHEIPFYFVPPSLEGGPSPANESVFPNLEKHMLSSDEHKPEAGN